MDIEIRVADTYLQKLRGLMFRRKTSYGLLIPLDKESRIMACIHSLFVFFRFDAVFLDSDMRIVDIRKNIRPFTPLIVPNEPSRYILELPAGKAEEENLEIGQEIEV